MDGLFCKDIITNEEVYFNNMKLDFYKLIVFEQKLSLFRKFEIGYRKAVFFTTNVILASSEIFTISRMCKKMGKMMIQLKKNLYKSLKLLQKNELIISLSLSIQYSGNLRYDTK